jgi:thiol-disulfide isomerase/thioredoxin
MQNKIILFCLLFAGIFFGQKTIAQQPTVNMYLFWGDGCPHCAAEHEALPVLKEKYPQLQIYTLEVWYDQNNQALMQTIAEALGTKATGVPFTVIGDKYFSGFNEQTSISQFETRIQECLNSGCPDSTAALVGISKPTPTPPPGVKKENSPSIIELDPELKTSEDLSEFAAEQEEESPYDTQVYEGLARDENKVETKKNPVYLWALIILLPLLLVGKILFDRKK